MPKKYIKQMIMDWNGMSRKFGVSTMDYYLKNKATMILHPTTIEDLEYILGV